MKFFQSGTFQVFHISYETMAAGFVTALSLLLLPIYKDEINYSCDDEYRISSGLTIESWNQMRGSETEWLTLETIGQRYLFWEERVKESYSINHD